MGTSIATQKKISIDNFIVNDVMISFDWFSFVFQSSEVMKANIYSLFKIRN